MKGNCGFFEFPRLEALSHAAEDALADVRAGRRQPDAALVSAVLAIIDRIGEMVAAIEAGEELPAGDDSALIAGACAGRGGPAAPRRCCRRRGARQGRRRAAHHPPVGRTARPGDEHASPTWCWRATSLPAACANRRPTCRSTARSSACRRSSPRCATRSPAPACSGSRICSSACRAWSATCRAELGKQVLVDIEGGDVELDREMIEMIRDPLTHIIRNAVDHGIEMPAERLKAGKREIGMLSRLGAPVGQPDPDRHPRRRPRHRRQEAGRKGDRHRRARQGRRRRSCRRANSSR